MIAKYIGFNSSEEIDRMPDYEREIYVEIANQIKEKEEEQANEIDNIARFR